MILRRAALALIAVAFSLTTVDAALSTLPAYAEGSEPAVSWAAVPADEEGPDGRRWVENVLDPGATKTEHLAVTNLGSDPVTFALKAADGYFTDTGRFTMLPSSSTSVDAGTWIAVQDTVDVQPGETEVVAFTISVPEGAAPGDHPAGIAATVLARPAAGDSQAVGVEGRVGFRVLTRVTGDLTPALAVDDVVVRYEYSWNPFAPGQVSVEYTLRNEGNVALGVKDRVVSVSPGGDDPGETGSPELTEMFAGDERTIRSEVQDVWLLGPLTARVAVHPTALQGGEPVLEPATAEVTAWVFPWPQSAVVLIVAVTVVLVRLDMRRRRRVWAERIAEARALGRAESDAGTAG
ncbi:hypothetical protein [Microbacterium algeriense]|uniref:hypothetical protein n=1 Tax=Microbacterium algeriense TaxID=2615184 RepID=UPI0022E250C4|nr:hypothetical protein [Microbacterium algeriense]